MKKIDLSKRKNRGMLLFIPAAIYTLLVIGGFLSVIYEIKVNPSYFIIPGMLVSFMLVFNAILLIRYDTKQDNKRIK